MPVTITTANEAAEKATAAKMEVELAQWNQDEKIKEKVTS